MPIFQNSQNLPVDDFFNEHLGWKVERRKMQVDGVGEVVDIFSNVRADTNTVLGYVGKKYQLVQNIELLELAKAVCQQDPSLKIDTIAVIKGGYRVVIVLTGTPITLQNGDKITPQLMLVNGFDGTSIIGLFTTLRFFCLNQLPMMFARARNHGVKIRHTGNMQQKLKEAENLLSKYADAMLEFQVTASKLTTATMVTVTPFFMAMYDELFGELPEQTAKNYKKKVEAKAASIERWQGNWLQESALFGRNYWIAANAVTKDLQHNVRGKDSHKKKENRLQSNLFGKNDKESQKVFQFALKYSGVG